MRVSATPRIASGWGAVVVTDGVPLTSVATVTHASLTGTHGVGDLAGIGHATNVNFHVVLPRAGDGNPADTEDAVEDGLLQLDVTDVIVLDFGRLAIEYAAGPDRSFAGDG